MALLIKKVGALTGMLTISIAMILVPYYWLATDLAGQVELLSYEYRITTLDTSHGYWAGAIVSGIGVLLFSCALPVAKRHPKVHQKVVKSSTIVMCTGILVFVLGSIAAKFYWHNSMKNLGYTQCNESRLVDIDRLHRSIWAKKLSYCENPQVARMLRSADQEELERVDRFLKGEPAR